MWVLARPNGDALEELTTASGKRIAFKRNGVPEATCTLSLEDSAAAKLIDSLAFDGIPTLRCYRDGQLVFNGYASPFTEDLEEAATLNLTFRGPFGRLLGDGDSGGRFTSEFESYIDDAGQIAKQLIDATNTDSATGIVTTGTVEATKDRERTYEYANIGEAIVNLTSVLDGFDFEVEPINENTDDLGRLFVYARQGEDLTSNVDCPVFEYGPGTLANVRSVHRETRPPINVARVLGADGLVGLKRDEGSILQYGEWWTQIAASDVSEQATLDDKAQALIRPEPIRVVSFTPEPALAPSPWDDFWLGDSVRFRGRRGAFVEDVAVRVNEVAVVIDTEGQESAEIPDPTDPAQEASLRAELAVELV